MMRVEVLRQVDAICDDVEEQLRGGQHFDAARVNTLVNDVLRASDRQELDQELLYTTLAEELISLCHDYDPSAVDESQWRDHFPELDWDQFARRLGRSTSIDRQLPAGTLVGKYEVRAFKGRGGMGTVYRAWHPHLKCDVALKLHDRRSSTSADRLRREMQTVGQIRHANVVPAYDAGEFQGRPFLVAQWIEGTDLQQYVQRHGPADVADAIRWTKQIASALVSCHGHGWVHRDVKPSNIMLDSDGIARVTDFGLAKPVSTDEQGGPSQERPPQTCSVEQPNVESSTVETSAGLRQTRAGDLMGSIDFISPEQIDNAATAGPASDLYALGCTLFYLVTGRVPFPAETVSSRLRRHRQDAIPNLTDEVVGWSAQHQLLLDSLCAKQPSHRPRDAGEVMRRIDALNGIARDIPLTRRRIGWAVTLGALGLLFVSVDPFVGNEPGRVRSVGSSMSIQSSTADAFDFEPDQLQAQVADRLGRPIVRDVGGIAMILIPPGKALLGYSEAQVAVLRQRQGNDVSLGLPQEPQHVFEQSVPFRMAQTEITVRQFRDFVDSTGYRTLAEQAADKINASSDSPAGSARELRRWNRSVGWGIDGQHWEQSPNYSWREMGAQSVQADMPVANLSVQDAVAYCRWFSKQNDVTARLPTMQEWEYAAAAGTNTWWSFGDAADSLPEHAWFGRNADNRFHPVGKRKPNPWGLFDTVGNVAEWCDPPHVRVAEQGYRPRGPDDPSVIEIDSYLAVKGGTFLSTYDASAKSVRFRHTRSTGMVGFRILVEP